MSAEGVGTNGIVRASGKDKTVVWRWQERFMHEGVDGLLRDKTRPPGKAPLPPEAAARVVELSGTAPPGEATHRTAEAMAKAAGISASSVRRIRAGHGLAPHRVRRFEPSNDPDFAAKLRDVVGLSVDPPALTVGDYLDQWLEDVAPASVAPKALERDRGLVRNQINPHLGTAELQKLRPADVAAWLQVLGKTGIGVRSIRHAHGVLRSALGHAAAVELVERNVAAIIKPPKLARAELDILHAEQIANVLEKPKGHSIYPVAALAIGTGARRGEIAAPRWHDLDLDAATVRIERSLEQTKDGLRVKAPKTAAGRRTVSLPAFAADALRKIGRRSVVLREDLDHWLAGAPQKAGAGAGA